MSTTHVSQNLVICPAKTWAGQCHVTGWVSQGLTYNIVDSLIIFLLSVERPLFCHVCLHSLLCLDLICARSRERHVATRYQENLGPVSSVASADVERGPWRSFVRRRQFQDFISLRWDFWAGDSLSAPYSSPWVCLESRCLFSWRLKVWDWNYQWACLGPLIVEVWPSTQSFLFFTAVFVFLQ